MRAIGRILLGVLWGLIVVHGVGRWWDSRGPVPAPLLRAEGVVAQATQVWGGRPSRRRAGEVRFTLEGRSEVFTYASGLPGADTIRRGARVDVGHGGGATPIVWSLRVDGRAVAEPEAVFAARRRYGWWMLGSAALALALLAWQVLRGRRRT